MIFFQVADELEDKKLWRFADQCRGVGMSIPNNIAESTRTQMKGEQRQLLRVSRRECFEGVNIFVILELKGLVSHELKVEVFERLDIEARRIQSYSDSL